MPLSASYSMPSWPPGAMSASGGQLGWTLERHILDRQRKVPGATGDFTGLFQQIALCAKIIGSRVNQAGLAGILGVTGKTNVQGEQVQKLDEFANETMKSVLGYGGHVCVMASEEDDDLIEIPEDYGAGKYVMCFDPLDGSSNIDVNISIGTIFSIQRRVTVGLRGSLRDLLQKGTAQVAAGYVIYGSSMMLVYTTGSGVHGFTLDPTLGEFLLSHENIRLPDKGRIYSVNEGNSGNWTDGVRRWVDWCKQNDDETGRPYSARYVGSLVADFHRTLLKGGVFAYPADHKSPAGKLRLLYEAAPMAFIAEAAGGAATDGRGTRILDIPPEKLHQRCPLLIGSRRDVETAESFFMAKE